MELKIFKSAVEASEFVANELVELIKENAHANLGVATGRTMDAIYHRFISQAGQEKVDVSKVNAFAVDEYVGLKSESPNSYEAYLKLHLFEKLNFNSKNLHIPNIHAEDLDDSAKVFEDLIVKKGGIDLQLLGVGLNGHIGLNEPGSAIDSRTRLVALTHSTMKSNKVLFKNEGMPVTALTMGIGTILDSKRCLLVATGETKAVIVQKIINGDVNSKIPATAIKQHSNAIFVLDQAAASLI